MLLCTLALTGFGRADGQSQWVYPGAGGKLTYRTLPAGDRIMDFSYAGYGGGGVAVPDVPVKATVQPGGDDPARACLWPTATGVRCSSPPGPIAATSH